MDKVDRLLEQCDLFVSIGTSGVVFPAASFVQIAKLNGAETYEFNLETTSNNRYFDHHIYGKAGETVPQFVEPSLPKFPSSKKIKHLTPFRSTDALLFTCESFQTKALTAIIIFNHKATSEIN